MSERDIQRSNPHHLQANLYLPIAVGGVIGTTARYEMALLLPTTKGHFPFATLIVNIFGSFVLGLLLESLSTSQSDVGLSRRLRLLIGTGFCGSLTTFSTFATEADLLIKSHDVTLALAYLAVTILAGLLATTFGIKVANLAIAQKHEQSGANK